MLYTQLILLLISLKTSLIHGLFKSILSNFKYYVIFPAMFLLLISSLIPLWPENILCIIAILLNFLNVYCVAQNMSIFWMFHLSLKIMCILLLLNLVFCKCQLVKINDRTVWVNYNLILWLFGQSCTERDVGSVQL